MRTFYEVPTSVNYVSEAMQAPTYQNMEAPNIALVAEIMRNGPIHRLVREKGGAYAGFSSYDSFNGLFQMGSYRDPHNVTTYHHFETALKMIADGKFTEKDVDEAKLSLFSKYDAPIAPHQKGLFEWYSKRNQLEWNMFRETALEASKKDIQQAADNHLIEALENNGQGVSRAIFGKLNDGEKERLEKNGWEVQKFMQPLEQHAQEMY